MSEEEMLYQYRVWNSIDHKWVDMDDYCLLSNGKLAYISVFGVFKEVERDWPVIELATGYTDMHGTMVYQGDILWNTHWPVSQRDKIVIEWTSEADEQLEMVGFLNYSDEGWEIIGNIHENPDLLEKVKGQRHDE